MMYEGKWVLGKNNMKTGRIAAVFILAFALFAAAAPARAEVNDGSIRLTPDTTKIIRLNEDAASVIVANPMHADIVLDSPRLLVVMPRQPGTTLFTVLNAEGKTLLETNVIVSGTAKPQYVRIRRACSGQQQGCMPSSYYYCPDGCYEVGTVGGTPQGTMAPPPLPSSGSIGSIYADDTSMAAPPPGADVQLLGNDPSLPVTMPPTEPGGGVQIMQGTGQ